MPEIVYHLSLVVQTFIHKIVKNQVAFGLVVHNWSTINRMNL